MPRFDWRWLVVPLLLLQFVSEAHGSAGAWSRNTLRGQSVLNWGAARTGSGNAGVAAEDSYIPLQNRTAEVGHASAANEMQTLWVLQQHKQNLVKSFKSPMMLLLVLVFLFLVFDDIILAPSMKEEAENRKAENVHLRHEDLLTVVMHKYPVVDTCLNLFRIGFAYAFIRLGLAILKLPFNPYARLKIGSLAQYLVKKIRLGLAILKLEFNPYARLKIGSLAQYLMKQVQEMSQLAMEQLQGSPQPEPPQQQQPEEEVDEASTDRS